MTKGNPPAPKTPQAKKALSYALDRRNAYRENDKASRKLIPLRKARENRQDRRKIAQALDTLTRLRPTLPKARPGRTSTASAAGARA